MRKRQLEVVGRRIELGDFGMSVAQITAGAFAGIAIGLFPITTKATEVSTNDVVIVEFQLPGPPPPPPSGPVDVLSISPLNADLSQFGNIDATVSLFDGNTLLGTYEIINGRSAFFEDSASEWQVGNPTVIDFTSIRDGSIDGRMEYRVTRLPNDPPSVDINLFNTNFELFKSVGTSNGEGMSFGNPQITNAIIAGNGGGANPLLSVDINLFNTNFELCKSVGAGNAECIPFWNNPQITNAFVNDPQSNPDANAAAVMVILNLLLDDEP